MVLEYFFSILKKLKLNFKKNVTRTVYVHVFLLFFQLCGNCPISLKGQKKIAEVLFSLISTLYIIVIFGIFFIFYVYRDHIFHNYDPSGYFNDILQFVAPIFAHLVILLESIFNRTIEKSIWKKIESLEKIVSKSNKKYYDEINFKFYKNFLLKFIAMNVIGTLPEIYIIVSTKTSNPEWARTWYGRLLSFYMTRSVIIQIILYIDFITTRLQILNKEMYLLIENMESALIILKKTNYFQYEIICKQKRLNYLLCEISRNVNERFGWSLVMIMANFFLCITVDFYFIYLKIHYSSAFYFVGK